MAEINRDEAVIVDRVLGRHFEAFGRRNPWEALAMNAGVLILGLVLGRLI